MRISVETDEIDESEGFFLFYIGCMLAYEPLINKKKSDLLVTHQFQLAEDTGFEPVDTLRYRQFSKLLV